MITRFLNPAIDRVQPYWWKHYVYMYSGGVKTAVFCRSAWKPNLLLDRYYTKPIELPLIEPSQALINDLLCLQKRIRRSEEFAFLLKNSTTVFTYIHIRDSNWLTALKYAQVLLTMHFKFCYIMSEVWEMKRVDSLVQKVLALSSRGCGYDSLMNKKVLPA